MDSFLKAVGGEQLNAPNTQETALQGGRKLELSEASRIVSILLFALS